MPYTRSLKPPRKKNTVRMSKTKAAENQGEKKFTIVIAKYLRTRLTSLDPRAKITKGIEWNPFRPLMSLNKKQWAYFMFAFWGWTLDSMDFFTVSLTVTDIAKSLDELVKNITWGITLVLMLRPVGAIAIGLLSENYGRKPLYIVTCLLFVIFELTTGFAQTFRQFLALRALFGISMGGMYGLSASCLEVIPVKSRGVVSGFVHSGYCFGYLLAVLFSRALVTTTPHGWRSLFWFCSTLPVILIVFRIILPETQVYLSYRKQESMLTVKEKFILISQAFKSSWLIFVYLVLFLSVFNFTSHGSQDLYPTMLRNQLDFTVNASTVTMCISNIGGFLGCILLGHFGQVFGRRLAIIGCTLIGGALIYPWAFVTSNKGVNASVFFMQFVIMGSWGSVPAYLVELSPSRYIAFIAGSAYNIGTLASSASSTIEAQIGEKFKLKDGAGNIINGKYDYSRVMAILLGSAFAFLVVIVFLGPENHGALLVENDLEADNYSVEEIQEFSEKV